MGAALRRSVSPALVPGSRAFAVYSLKAYIPYYRRNLRIAFPVMLTQLGAALVGLADSIMVGHYGTTDLAAVSLGNGIFFTVMVFSMGSLMGITPLTGQAFVQNDDRRVAMLLQNGLLFTLIVGGITCGLLALCVPFMDRMGQDPAVVEAARPYLITRIAGLLPFLYFCVLKQFLEGLGNTLVAMLVCLALNLLNILLNWVFIFGHWGAEPMGAYGAGLASLIATSLMPVAFFAAILLKAEWRRYLTLFSRRLTSCGCLAELARVGFPIGIQTTMETVLFTLSFIMVGWIGKEALAAHHIANNVADFAFMLSLGVGAATTIRVSHQYGLHDYHAMQMAARASVHLILLMNTVGAALMIGLRNWLPLLFSDDPEVIRIASPLLVFAGLFQYADGLQCVGAGMLRGITDVRRPMHYAFLSYVLIALPLGYVLMFPAGMGVEGMWVSFIVALSLAAFFFHARFRRLTRRLPAA
ncbi:MAG: MATE family efflux transporter [Paludibacteraceae bacterium]|nr:MATE family efflux transporter [Paludibacteraceae bacterium]